MALLEHVAKRASSRKKRRLQRVILQEGLWEAKHAETYEKTKKALIKIAPLAHPEERATVCVFADASQEHWGGGCDFTARGRQ